ncbi:MAG: YDG domain-containing protein [Arcicella sp.]|nr:YDG domain-containing protein [Arcicella sp.]
MLWSVRDMVDVAPIQTYDNKTQGTGKTLTPSGLTIKNGATDVTGNYDITYTAVNTGVIEKATVIVTAVASTKTYDGTTASAGMPTVGALVGTDMVDVAPIQTYDNKTQGAGKTLTPSGLTIKNGATDVTGNYDITYTAVNTGVIEKATVIVTAVASTKTYDGTTASAGVPTVGALVGTDMVDVAPIQTYDNKTQGTGKTLTPSGLTIKNGATDVTGNYDITYTAVNTGVIEKATVTVTAVASTKTYDGTTASAGVPTVGALVGTDMVDVAPIQTYDNKTQGTGKTLTPSGLTIKNGATDVTGNYDITYTAVNTGVIEKATVIVTAVVSTKTYDGTTASAGMPTVGALVGTDMVDVAPIQTYDNKTQGTGKTLTPSGLTIKNGATDVTGNYDITYTAVNTGVIEKATVIVTAVASTKTYDGTTASAGVPTVGALVSGDMVDVAPIQTYDNKTQGAGKTLTPSGLTIKNGATDVTGNYDITYTAVNTGVIEKATVIVTAVASTKTYDGTTASAGVPTVGALVSGDMVDVAPIQTYDNKTQGTGKTLTPSGLTIKNGATDVTGNYDITYTAVNTGVIEKATVIVTAVASTKTYDGTTASAGVPTVGALVSGDMVDVAPIQTYDNKTQGAGKTLTPSGLTIKNGATDVTGNYDITYTAVNTGVIEKATVIVTAVASTKTYDGTTASAGVPTVGALVSGDMVDVAPIQTYDNKTQGTGKTLTPSGLTIKNGATDVTGNYDITYTAVNTGVIEKLNITGSFTASNKPYDGTDAATVLTRTLSGVISPDDVTLIGETATFDNKNVGTDKTVTLTGTTLSGTTAGNYTLISVGTTTADITPITLTITASNRNKCEGTIATFLGTEFTTVGLVSGDVVTSVTLSSTGAASTVTKSSGPNFPIVATNAVGTGLSNYNITYVNGTLTITSPTLVVIPSPAPCFGDLGGAILQATGGSPTNTSYTFTSNPSTNVTIASNILTAPAGVYVITVTDEAGCTKAGTLTISQPTLITGSGAKKSYNGADLSCATSTDGEITVTATGGTGAKEYSINNGAYVSTNVFQNLAAGTYTLKVKDANGCEVSLAPVTITAPSAVVAGAPSSTQSNVTCFGGNNGSIDLTVTPSSGGTVSRIYSYVWSKTGGGFTATTEDIGSLTAGTYSVLITATDVNGCTGTTSLIGMNVSQPAPLAATITAQTNVDCNGNSTGSVTVTATSGTGTSPYEYKIGTAAYGTTNIFGTLAAGTYTIMVKDANGCETTVPVTITEPAPLAATITAQTNVDCNGNSTGSVTVTATSGTGTSPYEYKIGTAAYGTTNIFGTLAAGTYTIMVKDANGCETTVPVTITEPAPLAATITAQTNVDCNGNSTGSVTVTATSGTGTSPYEYKIGTAAYGTTNIFGTLAAGTYTIMVKDANGCETTVPVTITEPAPLAATITAQTNVDCNGNSTGSVTVTATSGTGTSPYEYKIGTAAYGTTNIFGTLAAGTYTIMVKDANGCETTVPVTITEPAPLAATITAQTNVDCNGNSTGSVTVTATSGTGTSPYEYKIGTAAYGTTNIFGTLAAGTYTIMVKDANGCETTVPVTITEPAPLAATITAQTNVDCNGNSTGSVTVTATSGTGTSPYEYKIGTAAYGTTNIFGTLAAGTYTIMVKDANGCETTVPVTITEPAPLAATITAQTNVDCNGNSTGSVTVTATSGTGTSPYEYKIGTAAYGTTNIFGTLAAGTYTIMVKDANGCETTVPVTITEPAPLAATITAQTNVDCNGNSTGSVTVTATSGTGTSPYEYKIGTAAYGTTNIFGTLAAGTYTIMVKDANGCETTVPVTITEPAPLAATITAQTNVDCNGNSTGSVTVTATSGTGTSPYEYKIGTAAYGTTNIFGTLAAGTYTIMVKDANGCETTVPVTITEPAPLAATITAQTNVDCNGNSTGSVTVTATSGTGTSPYEYKIGTAAYGTTNIFGTLAAGTYTIMVKDANGCETTVPVTITEPAPLAATITAQTNVDCNGNSTGSVTVTATSGTGTSPYEYKIGTAAYGTTNIFGTLAAGTYTIMVKDANGCETTVPVTITEPAPLAATITAQTNVDCNGNSTGSVTVTATSGTGTSPYEYKIGTAAYGTTNIFGTLAAGTYTIMVKDANGCETTVPVTITEPAPLAATITAQTNVDCNGNSTGSVTVTATSGTGTSPYEYKIGTAAYGTTNIFGTLAAGTYTIMVKDANGCETTVPVTITEPAPLAATITAQTNVDCNGNSTGSVTVTATSGTGTSPYEYKIGTAAYGTTNIFGTLAAGTYTIMVKDANGCETTVPVTITEPAPLAATITAQTNVDCNGNSTGSVTVTATSGTGTSPYEYKIGTAAYGTTNIFGTLAAGTYTIMVKDANGCETTVPVTITEPAAIVASIPTQVDVLCKGSATGTATASATGGTAPFTYLWSNAQTTITATGLIAGTYTVTITDAGGCSTTATTEITQPATNVSVTVPSQVNVLCKNDATGTATALAANGTGSHTYLWSNGQTAATATGLIAGTYTVTVSDANTCTATATVMITEPTSVTSITASSNTPVCEASALTLTSMPTSSTGGLTYAWAGPNSFTASTQNAGITVTTLAAAGVYTVTVTDGNSCVATATTAVIINPLPTVYDVTGNPAICSGVASPIRLSGSMVGVNYKLTATGFGGSVLAGTGSALEFTPPSNILGTYTIEATNPVTGCKVLMSGSVTTTNATDPTITVTAQTNVSCKGGNDGSVTVLASTGSGSYNYSFNAGTVQSSGTFGGILAGTYPVVANDISTGCKASVNVTITEPATLPTATVASSGIACVGNTVTLTATATGGTAPYTYTWNGTVGTSTLLVTSTSTNTLVVTDSKGCVVPTVSTTVTFNTPVLPTITGATTLCSGSTLSLSTSAVGTYAWSGPNSFTSTSASISITNAQAVNGGAYTVTVTDANSCVVSAMANVIINLTPTASITPTSVILTCANPSTALTASGGNTYSWTATNAFTASTAIANITLPGTYTVTASSASGCISTASVTVTENKVTPTVAITSTATVLTCSTPSTTITATGADTYSWTSTNGFTASTANATITTAGIYTVIGTNANGCSASATVEITEDKATPTVTVTPTTAILTCLTPSTTITASGATSYAWSSPAGFTATTATADILVGGIYTVIGTNANGCSASATVEITEDKATPTVTVTPTTAILTCLTPSTTITASGATSYAWSGTGGFTATTATADISVGGIYTVIGTNANGCSASATVEITEDKATPTVTVTPTTAILTCLTPSTTITASGATSYAWSSPAGFTATTATADISVGGIYTVIGTNANGCSASATVEITEDKATPTVTVTPTTAILTCLTPSTTITASGATSYAWSSPAGFTATTATADILVGGIYTVIGTNANGCSASATVEITEDKATPTVTVTPTTAILTCLTPSTTITASGATSYAWSSPAGFTATTATADISVGGIYTVIGTNANGCSASATVEITEDKATPTVTVTPTTAILTCLTPSTTITASGATSYAWSSPAGFTATTATADILVGGIYTVIGTNANGCSASATVEITEDKATPTVTVTPTTAILTCLTPSTTITASGAISYAWSSPAGFTATTATADILVGGIYTVIGTNANGCSASATVEITEDKATPTVTVTPTTAILTCLTPSTTITASGATSYAWSSPAGFTATTATADILVGGIYTVIGTNANGCSASATVEITEDKATPTVTVTPTTAILTCLTPSTTITASGATSYAWSSPAGFTATTATADILVGGIYTVIGTNANGCSASATVEITEDKATPTVTVTPTTAILTCLTPSTTITASGQLLTLGRVQQDLLPRPQRLIF